MSIHAPNWIGEAWRETSARDSGRIEARYARPRLHASAIDRQAVGFCWVVAAIWLVGLTVDFRVALSVLAVAGILATLWGIVTPHWAALGLGILCAIDPLMRVYLLTGGFLRWNTVNYVLLLACVVYSPMILTAREPPVRILLVFLAFLIFELAWSLSKMSGAYHVLNLIAAVGIYLSFRRAYRQPETLYWAGVVACLNAACAGLVYFLVVPIATRMDANAFSYVPIGGVFGACLAVHLALLQKRRYGFILALCVACLVWIFLSGSRGGILVSVPCLLFLLVRLPGLSRKVVWLLAGAVMLVALLNQFPELTQRTIGRFYKLTDDNSSVASRTSGRSDLAYGAWRIFVHNPLGVGTGGFSKEWAVISIDEGDRLSGYKRGAEQTCHSAWLKTLCENGVPGFALLGLFVMSFAWVGWHSPAEGRWPLALLVTSCLAISFVSTEFAGKSTWLLASSAIVLLRPVARYYPTYSAHGVYAANY